MPLYFFFEALALLVAILLCFRSAYKPLQAFIPFLLVIVLFEWGTLQGWFTINKSNLWSVNIITLIEFVFFAFFLHSILSRLSNKKKIVWIMGLILILSVVNIVFVQGLWRFHSYTYLLGAITIITFCCIYFSELMDQDLGAVSIALYPFFWICTGLLFFYLGQFLFFAFFEYMAYKKDYSYYSLFKVISNVSNVILYSCLSIGFLCAKPLIRKSL